MTNFLDRTGIRIIRPLLKWYLEDENLQYDEDFYQVVEDLYVNYNLDFESWVDFVLEEYPSMEQVGSTFDLEYTWEQFQDTKEGKKFEKILNNYLIKEIDMIEFRDYVLDLDSEIPKKYNELKNQLEGFFNYNKFGKKLSINDKKLLVKAFSKRGSVYFKNGFVFSPSDWAGIDNISNKDKLENPNDFVFIFYTDTENYKGLEIQYMIFFYMEEIAKNILKK